MAECMKKQKNAINMKSMQAKHVFYSKCYPMMNMQSYDAYMIQMKINPKQAAKSILSRKKTIKIMQKHTRTNKETTLDAISRKLNQMHVILTKEEQRKLKD